jgi:hypothetical protein
MTDPGGVNDGLLMLPYQLTSPTREKYPPATETMTVTAGMIM